MIYYPVPLPPAEGVQELRAFAGRLLPVTEQLMQEVLSLPMSTELDNEQLTHITADGEGFFN
jgi:UDP-2-acetamido-2-deoxy-ribo-hexuluronate aminotransferase